MEQREYPRISLLGKIDIKPRNSVNPVNGYAINISKGGVALYTERAFDINTELLLTIFFKYDIGEKMEDVAGIVRWIKPVGDIFALGVQFKEVRRETHPMIFAYLEINEVTTPP